MISFFKYGQEELEEVYVRCQYLKNLFEDEAQIKMGFYKEWINVRSKDVVKIKNECYAIKAWKVKKYSKEGIILALIRDIGNYKLRIREVALDDVISEKEFIQNK
jgi:hypothetical protein